MPQRIGKIRNGSLCAQELSSDDENTTPAIRRARKSLSDSKWWLESSLQDLSSEDDSSSDNENTTPAIRRARKSLKDSKWEPESILQDLSEDDSSSDEKGEETIKLKKNDIVEVVKDKNAGKVVVELVVSSTAEQFANEKVVTFDSDKSSGELDDEVCYKETDGFIFEIIF